MRAVQEDPRLRAGRAAGHSDHNAAFRRAARARSARSAARSTARSTSAAAARRCASNRFDANNSFGANGSDTVFAVAGRGNVLLPKDGSWTMVKHARGTRGSDPVPRTAFRYPQGRRRRARPEARHAHPERRSCASRTRRPAAAPVDDTINYGFLQSTDTQKALFLTPAFESGEKQLFSKTPPLFVDAFGSSTRRRSSRISATPRTTSATRSRSSPTARRSRRDSERRRQGRLVADGHHGGGRQCRRARTRLQAGQGGPQFDLPNKEFELIDVGEGNFRIYIEYEATNRPDDGNAERERQSRLRHRLHGRQRRRTRWKSRMGNIGIVVDLGRLSIG